ncbi:MAG: hypothetical protein HN647_03710 [Candidatus Marinimicrobia bacterium]|nr:hypothetical protein [Candidatus Neomarinimicrobiota bacterium]MBT7985665.1 hypothetical protein [Candidatus Neomarinimicrobiota bacterium]
MSNAVRIGVVINRILDCEKCNKVKTLPEDGFSCDRCENPDLINRSFDFKECPVCGGKQFYKRKDFNSALGCIMVLIGALFVPLTYGLSLLVVAILDWALYRKISNSVVCYLCKAEFKKFGNIPEFINVFDHHTAELYEEP